MQKNFSGLSGLGFNRENNDGADVPVVIENTRICKEMQKAESYKMLMVQ